MAWTKVQSLINHVSGTPVTRGFTAGAVGNLLVVACGTGSNTSGNPTIADSQTNVWTPLIASPMAIAGGGKFWAWWARAKNTTASTITCTATSPGGFMNILYDEFSGGLASGSMLGAALGNTGSGTPTFGPITTTAADSLIWAGCNDSVTAVGAGFTKGADDTVQDWTEYKILSGSSGTSQSATFTGSGTYIGIIAEFLIAGGGGSPTLPIQRAAGGNTRGNPFMPMGHEGMTLNRRIIVPSRKIIVPLFGRAA